MDTRYLSTLQAVYSVMSKADRVSIPQVQNPFFTSFELLKESFVKDVVYYDLPQPVEFLAAYGVLVGNLHCPNVITAFMKEVTTKLLPDTHHVNSYLQVILI